MPREQVQFFAEEMEKKLRIMIIKSIGLNVILIISLLEWSKRWMN